MRTLISSILVAAALAAALLGWFEAGWSAVERREGELRAEPRKIAEAEARGLAGDLVQRLEALRISEARRPYYHYQSLFHDPRSAAEGLAVAPSPLASGPVDPLVRGHFQINGSAVTMPTLNDEIAELNNPTTFADDTALRGELVAAADKLTAAAAGPALSLPTLVAAADTTSPTKRIRQRPPATSDAIASTAAGSGTGAGAGAGSGTTVAIVDPPDVGQQTLQLSQDQYVQNAYSNNAYNLARENQRVIDPNELQQQSTQQPQQQRRRNPQQQQQQSAVPPQQQSANPPPQQQVVMPQPQAANPPPNANPNPNASANDPAPTTTPTTGTGTTPVTTTTRRHHSRPKPTPPPAPAPITIAIAPLEWHELTIGGRATLVALRRVDTPDGTLTQGLIVDPESVSAYIEDRLPGARLMYADEPATATADLPVGSWKVGVPMAVAGIESQVAAVRSAFWGRFVPVSALAALCGMLVVVVVARAERLAKARSRFAASAAHELRTPLAGLQLYGDMLADGLGDPNKAQQYAHRISEEASRLGRVVANVLGFSQLERGDLSITPRDGDAAAAARDLVDRVRPTLERAGVTFEVELDDELPARFDPDAMTRILGNLVDNAEKYSRGAESRVIGLVGRRAGDKVELAVTDSGPGVATGARLFVPFSRGVGTDGPAGLGLGLALSRSLARAMGGDLAHTGGARFVLSLPAA